MSDSTVPETMESGAVFSPCRTYRYRLTRRWGDGPVLNVIGLNPSTADETVNDPTIRRCIGFAKAWGYDGLVMTNLCDFRATDPKDLWRAPAPASPDNDAWVQREAQAAGLVLVAWGANIMAKDAGRHAVLYPLRGVALYCLGTTQDGSPRHPLYVRADTTAIPFEPAS